MLTIQLVSTGIGTVVFAVIPFIVTGIRNFAWTIACIATLSFGALNALLSAGFTIVMFRRGHAMGPDSFYADIAFGAAIPLALMATALAITLLRKPTNRTRT